MDLALVNLTHSRSLKVTDFGTVQKPICDFLYYIQVFYLAPISELSWHIGHIIAFDRGAPI